MLQDAIGLGQFSVCGVAVGPGQFSGRGVAVGPGQFSGRGVAVGPGQFSVRGVAVGPGNVWFGHRETVLEAVEVDLSGSSHSLIA